LTGTVSWVTSRQAQCRSDEISLASSTLRPAPSTQKLNSLLLHGHAGPSGVFSDGPCSENPPFRSMSQTGPQYGPRRRGGHTAVFAHLAGNKTRSIAPWLLSPVHSVYKTGRAHPTVWAHRSLPKQVVRVLLRPECRTIDIAQSFPWSKHHICGTGC
jgi:hypothetical protein